jgi:hypothetical protein
MAVIKIDGSLFLLPVPNWNPKADPVLLEFGLYNFMQDYIKFI